MPPLLPRLACLLTLLLAASASAAPNDGYPTDARAEFVFACMATNGQTQEALRRCSCAIDVIAPDHKSAPLWKWLDTNAAQMGLQRPFPGIDPAHVLPRGCRLFVVGRIRRRDARRIHLGAISWNAIKPASSSTTC